MKKNNFQIITIAILIFISQGCNDFLKKEPLGQSVDVTFFNIDAKNAEYAVNAIYDAVSIDEGSTGQSSGMSHDWVFGSMLSDESDKGSVPSDFTDLTLLKQWTAPSNIGVAANYWSKMFVTIHRANFVIDNIDEAKLLDNDTKNQLKGEALFLRGYAYLHLARLFGGVPLLPKLPTYDELKSIRRATLQATYSFIENDFTNAISLLKSRNQLSAAQLGRATKDAARAYLAYTIMFEIGTDNSNGHNWQEVYDLTSAIINDGNYSLLSNYAFIWEDEYENSSESIFEYQYNYSDNDNYGGQKVGFDWVYRNPRSTWGWGFNTPSNALYQAFETNDPRKRCSIFDSTETKLYGVDFAFDKSKDVNGKLNRKALLSKAPDTYRSGARNDRKMGYNNVLLMHAEAAAHLNKDAEAKADIKLIRNRANASTRPKGTGSDPDGYEATGVTNPLDLSYLDPLTGGDLLEAIYHERQVELAMEGWRYYDQVRTGKYSQNIGLVQSRSIPRGGSVANPIPLLPIPVNELSWKLDQNPGY